VRTQEPFACQYCNHCGVKLAADSGPSLDAPQKLYADVAHPINSECRELIQLAVIAEFETELARSQQPGYRSRYDDEFDEPESPELSTGDQRPADGANPEHPDSARDVPPARIASKASPPRPHFIDRQAEKPDSAKHETSRDRGDDFGAGIF
jgi:stage V sporulation protein G